MQFTKLPKLKPGDKIAVISPSFAAPAVWPKVFELGLERLREVFGLEPVLYRTTSKLGASKEERAVDILTVFTDPEIKAVMASLGGDDQITYIKNIPLGVLGNNPKPFFGYSDNTHLCNHLWRAGVPSFYGACLFTQLAEQGEIHSFTVNYFKKALFEDGEFELISSIERNDRTWDWSDDSKLHVKRQYEGNEGWYWDGSVDVEGITWGGCLESLDELLRHGVEIPSLPDFKNIILILETSEKMPSPDYVHRVLRALGERGILSNIQGILVGRPQAWEINNQTTQDQIDNYRQAQREIILNTVRKYNTVTPIVQNLDFGHTNPQICMPYGSQIKIDSTNKKILAKF